MTPKITIGVPVLNGANYLEECLNSLLSQTFQDFEICISDNASDDATPEICRAFCEKDKRIHYFRQPQRTGASENFIQTFQGAKGEYFKWTAHDDLCKPTFLEKCLTLLENSPNAVVACSDAQLIDAKSNTLQTHWPNIQLQSKSAVKRFYTLTSKNDFRGYEVFGLIRTSALKKTDVMGGYYNADRILLLQLALQGPFCHTSEPLFISRQHPLQASSTLKQAEDWAPWFSKDKKQTFQLPNLQSLTERLKAIHYSPLTAYQKLVCYLYFAYPRHLLRYGKRILREYLKKRKQTKRRSTPCKF